MKKIFAMMIVFMMVGSLAWGGVVIKGGKVGSTDWYGTNFVSKALCAYLMTGNDGENEIDVTGKGHLLRFPTGIGTIPISNIVQTGFVGTAREFGYSTPPTQNTDSKLSNTNSISLAISGTKLLSVYALVRVQDCDSNSNVGILGCFTVDPASRQFWLKISEGSTPDKFKFSFWIYEADGTARTVDTTLDTYSENVYYSVIGVFNGSVIKIYVDGVLASGTTASTSTINSQSITAYVGGDQYAASVLMGKIDEAAIFLSDISSFANEIYTYGVTGKKGLP